MREYYVMFDIRSPTLSCITSISYVRATLSWSSRYCQHCIYWKSSKEEREREGKERAGKGRNANFLPGRVELGQNLPLPNAIHSWQ